MSGYDLFIQLLSLSRLKQHSRASIKYILPSVLLQVFTDFSSSHFAHIVLLTNTLQIVCYLFMLQYMFINCSLS